MRNSSFILDPTVHMRGPFRNSFLLRLPQLLEVSLGSPPNLAENGPYVRPQNLPQASLALQIVQLSVRHPRARHNGPFRLRSFSIAPERAVSR